MSLNSSKTRLLASAGQGIASAAAMLVDLPDCPTGADLQVIINAATQARQAAKDLDVLEGIIRATTR